MIDQASVGPAGRSVRCARCKSTWFAGAAKESSPGVSDFVSGVIAEAEAETGQAQEAAAPPPPPAMDDAPSSADEFGGEPFPPQSGPDSQPAPFDDASHNIDLAPHGDDMPAEPDEPDAMPMADAPSLVPPIEHDPLLDGGHHEAHTEAQAEADSDEVESFVARRQRLKARRQKSKRMSRWTAAILVLLAFNVALVGARSEIVRYLPQTASLFAAVGLPVNLRNLKFDAVKITKDSSDGVNILIVEGKIVNTANKPTEVPRLRFAARNAEGQDVYSWTALPNRSILGPNESMEFHSRLAAPPADARDVMVRFFTAQDAAAGIK